MMSSLFSHALGLKLLSYFQILGDNNPISMVKKYDRSQLQNDLTSCDAITGMSLEKSWLKKTKKRTEIEQEGRHN